MNFRFPIVLVVLCLYLAKSASAQPCAPVVNLGADISFCMGNSIVLNAQNPGSFYLWSTGATTGSITVSSGGTYWVRVSNSCGVDFDTIQIFTDQVVYPNLGANRPLCGGNMKLGVPSNSRNSYLWSTGATTDTISISNPGTYWVEVTNACGSFYDTVQISAAPPQSFSLGPDQFPCNANSYTLSIPNHISGNFTWSNGQTSRSITAYNSGYYWARVNTPCGVITDTIYLQFGQKINHGFPDTVSFCPNSSVTLQSPMQGTFQWSNGSNQNAITINQQGTYSLIFTHACGTQYDTVVAVERNSPVVNLGPDTTACQYLELDAKNPGASFVWNTGHTGPKLNVLNSGLYWVQVSSSCGSSRDSIFVNIKMPPGDSIPDTISYCPGSTTMIDAGSWYNASYTWSNGSSGQVAGYAQGGKSYVTISNSCGWYTDTFYVKADVNLNFSMPDTAFCDTNLVIYKAPKSSSTDSVLWSTGVRLDSIALTSSGLYWVTVYNKCDTLTDYFQVTVYPRPSPVLDSIKYKCFGSTAAIGTVSQPNVNYLWNTGQTSASISTSTAGTYWLRQESPCDTIVDTIKVINDLMPTLNLPSHIYVCRPNTVAHSLPYRPGAKFFVNGQQVANPVLEVTSSGTYVVEYRNSCGSAFDTVQITVLNSVVPVLSNKSFCSGGQLNLNAGQPQATSYLWNTGATTASINVTQGGWYYVDISNNCSLVRDSLYVREDSTLPQINLGNDTIFCQGQLYLNPGYFFGADYTWQNGSKAPTFNVQYSGQYHVTISNACNTVTDTINVLITGPPQAVLGNELRYCATHNFVLNAHNPGSTYLWSTGDTTQTLQIQSGGKYWVTISNNCGSLTDSVVAIPEYPLLNLQLGNDTIICQGQSLLLDPAAAGASITWSTGSTDTTLLVNSSGTYWLQAENLCGFFYDTIQVTVQDVPVFDIPDTSICYQADSITLMGPPNMQSYRWSDGSTQPFLTVSSVGQYALEVWNRCFSYTDTVNIGAQYPIEFGLPNDTSACENDLLQLDLRHIPYRLQWSDGSRSKLKTIRESGEYIVAAQNRCGVFSDTIWVSIHEDLKDSLQDVWLCRGDSLWVDRSNEPYQFLWANGDTNAQRSLREDGEYRLFIENLCGRSRHVYKVETFNCDCPMYMASAFTPNHDNLNDTYKPKHSCDLTAFNLKIFDRWGKLQFETNDADQGWDGFTKSGAVRAGTYLYFISYSWRVYNTEQSNVEKGYLTLIR